VRIAIRDLARLAETPEVIREISNAADAVLDAVFRICWSQITERFGRPYHLDPKDRWQPTAFSVLGLGKLGGRELNYSSDVDLMFVYAEEGFVFKEPPGRSQSTGKGLSNHQFFQRLIEGFISELTRLTPKGACSAWISGSVPKATRDRWLARSPAMRITMPNGVRPGNA
jgi:[glutamine synthetase] adenylyltransferase / [glutamine synthetase]-adenylyl-L-tyrosine phosphorylase